MVTTCTLPPAPATDESYSEVCTFTSLMLSGAGTATSVSSCREISLASTPLIWYLFCVIREPLTETFGELRPTALLLMSGAVTPGANASNCRKLRVGSGNVCRLRESMMEASSELSLRTGGGESFTVISALLCATVNLALIVLVSARPTATS